MIPRLDIHFGIKHKFLWFFGKEYSPIENEFLLNHNRSGLYLALKALGLPKGSKVGMMAYNCHTVMNAIWQAGLEAVFIDVNDKLTLDLNDLAQKSKGLSALIVTHLFGNYSDICSIRDLVPSIPIIEDCAHAYSNILCGIHGDFAVYSIGAGKNPSIGDGGILKVNNRDYLPVIKETYSIIPSASFKDNIKLFLSLSIKSILYCPFIYKAFTLRIKEKRSIDLTNQKPERLTRMAKGIRRIFGSTYYKSHYNDTPFMSVEYCENPINRREDYLRLGIDTDTHFKNCIIWARSYGYCPGDCPNAENLVNHLLMIPTYQNRKQ